MRTSPVKFAHLAEKSGKGSISNLSTKVRMDRATDATDHMRKSKQYNDILKTIPSDERLTKQTLIKNSAKGADHLTTEAATAGQVVTTGAATSGRYIFTGAATGAQHLTTGAAANGRSQRHTNATGRTNATGILSAMRDPAVVKKVHDEPLWEWQWLFIRPGRVRGGFS